jgi:hypothetical protein
MTAAGTALPVPRVRLNSLPVPAAGALTFIAKKLIR